MDFWRCLRRDRGRWDERNQVILEKIKSIRPKRMLDVGCGCGRFTVQIAPFCEEITAIDASEVWLKQAEHELKLSNVTFFHMDARNLSLPDKSFDAVMSRASLHHIDRWQTALDHMLRVSREWVLIEEPFDDLRSESRKNTYDVQQFFLELQNEIGYAHFNHIDPSAIQRHLEAKGLSVETQIKRSENRLDFNDYFGPIEVFAQKSQRREQWLERYAKLKDEYAHRDFIEPDTALFTVHL